MKVGILTFHSQLNYGGVLQCWALQTALEKLGHEVKVIDRWLDARNATLLGDKPANLKQFILLIFEIVSMNWYFAIKRRRRKTTRFISTQLNLTDYHFFKWLEAPKDLGVDVLVVGSDQVWNSYGAKDPSVYLLLGAPNVRAISYAASLGMQQIPESKKTLYAEGLVKFEKISVRETSAINLLSEFCGKVEKVADPVVLPDNDDWNDLSKSANCDENHRRMRMFCYFISENIAEHWNGFEVFAKSCGMDIDIFLSSSAESRGLSVINKLKMMFKQRVVIHADADPLDFLRALRATDCVLTDSFHAVMFSAIFNKNVRVLRPKSDVRKAMFDRIEELSDLLESPVNFMQPSVEAALESFGAEDRTRFSADKLSEMRRNSLYWLKCALTSVS